MLPVTRWHPSPRWNESLFLGGRHSSQRKVWTSAPVLVRPHAMRALWPDNGRHTGNGDANHVRSAATDEFVPNEGTDLQIGFVAA